MAATINPVADHAVAKTVSGEGSVFEMGTRLAGLLAEAGEDAIGGQFPEAMRERIADLAEGIRRRLARRAERDPRSLFELDERFIELMERADEEVSETGEVPAALLVEITDYLEAFRGKVDRIAGYCRWQESITRICGEEADRLAARKKAATGRVDRLKGMLMTFMLTRDLKKLEGETTSIALQINGNPSLRIDDPLQVGPGFYECSLRFTKTELQEWAPQLMEGPLRRRLEATLHGDGWTINESAVRAALVNNAGVSGARLVKGHHVRIR